MSSPLSPRSNPRFADYHDQVMRRDLRICGWLGLLPGNVLSVTDDDPNEYGEVQVHWESVLVEQPRHGKVTATGGRGGWGEPTIHSGTVWLPPDDARELAEVAGPRPEFPMPAEARAALERIRREQS